MSETYGYIYGLRNKSNGKWYIGQTIQEPYQYIRATYKFRKGIKRPKIYNAIKKYGYEGFDIILLDSAASKEELNKKEEDYIKDLDSIEKGYNIKAGGANGKIPMETRNKIIRTKAKETPEKKEEAKRKRLETINNKSPEERAETNIRISKARKGIIKMSLESIQKGLDTMAKKPLEELEDIRKRQKEKVSGEKSYMFGKPKSEEVIKKMVETINKKTPEERKEITRRQSETRINKTQAEKTEIERKKKETREKKKLLEQQNNGEGFSDIAIF